MDRPPYGVAVQEHLGNMDMYAQSQAAAPKASMEPPPVPSTPENTTKTNIPGQQSLDSRPAPPHPSPHGLNARSCVTCRKRKVKCNKQNPCSNCTKAGSQCVFPAPGRAPRRPKPGGKVMSDREAELLKRLRRLEGVVEELSGQVEVDTLTRHSPASDNSSAHRGENDSGDAHSGSGKSSTVRVVGMDEGSGNRRKWLARASRMGGGPPKTAYSLEELQTGVGRLVVDEGKSQYIASPFWTSVTDEVEEIRDMLDEQEFDSDSDTPIIPSDMITEPNHQSFIMGYNSSDVNLKSLHPLPSQIPFYWQVFLENVQPLVKIVHTPTMNKTIKEVQNNLSSLSRSTEALMFSIYFATVTSMSAAEVRTSFGVEKEILLKQYRFGVEQALARAGFLNTNEIVTVQAFVMFLVCVRRHDDTRFVWSMTGLALRVAQSLGIHRDGTKFGLSPFDTEMRRRIWWQVCILDTRASEDYGSDPSILDFSYDTQFPLSINDEDLDPNATEAPAPRPGVSEMTFCLIRYEICSLTRKLTYIPPGPNSCPLSKVINLEEKEKLVHETSERLETVYLQHCENAGPLYWVAATVARLIMAKMSLIIYHPLTQPGKPNELSQDVRDRLFMASIEINEYSRLLESEASTKQWGWLFHTYIQWHAIAYLLGELCVRPNSAIVDRAWRAIDLVFDNWGKGQLVAHSKGGMLWQPMKKLMAKARRNRLDNTRNGTIDTQNNGLGIPAKYVRPVAEAYIEPSGPGPENVDRYRHRIPDPTDTISMSSPPHNGNTAARMGPPISMPSESGGPAINSIFHIDEAMTMAPGIVGMGGLQALTQEQQMQMQMQHQNMQANDQNGNPTPTWLTEASNFMAGEPRPDLDMTLADWEGWDDLVKDFQMEVDGDINRGTAMGGIGQWW